MPPSCFGQKFGHDFPYPGANCLQCGVYQNALSGRRGVAAAPPLTVKKPIVRKRGLHSKDHLLADELAKYFREPKKFAMYLGVIKRIGFATALRILGEIKESRAHTPHKLFMWKVKQFNNKQLAINN